ncbi:MAG: ribosome recycling factor [Parcubacteria group bacterium GW2011_GWF2_38_76]|nr:MAG: ribosome recycling factor [Parcubacteria group bacterium GW2011_GWF2_38_76]HBM46092.1 ribosome recycling factor [Patescibacteria group bacterium]
MAYNFSTFKEKTTATANWLVQEFSGLRTGRATPALLDNVMTESYGVKVPITHIASISVEDARSLKIVPWDKSSIKDIERAVAAANLGVSTSPDSSGVRVIFPELTEDRRKTLAKVIKDKLEDARVTIRKEREDVWTDIQAKVRDSLLTEDDKFTLKDELQRLVDAANKNLEDIAEKKEKEIMGL